MNVPVCSNNKIQYNIMHACEKHGAHERLAFTVRNGCKTKTKCIMCIAEWVWFESELPELKKEDGSDITAHAVFVNLGGLDEN